MPKYTSSPVLAITTITLHKEENKTSKKKKQRERERPKNPKEKSYPELEDEYDQYCSIS